MVLSFSLMDFIDSFTAMQIIWYSTLRNVFIDIVENIISCTVLHSIRNTG